MKNFEEYFSLNENIDLSWENIFGKKYTHEETLKKNVIDGLVRILMEENELSEKSFKQIDEIVKKVKEKIDDNILEDAEIHLQSGKRMNLFYEILYDKLFKS